MERRKKIRIRLLIIISFDSVFDKKFFLNNYKGTKYYASGSVYFGNWENNKRNGKGFKKFMLIYIFIIHIQGLYSFLTGDVYEGYFKDGKPNDN